MYPDRLGVARSELDDVYVASEDEPKRRKTRSWHWDQAEHYLQLAADAAGAVNGPQQTYSEWCQRQAMIHATLAGSK